MKLAWIPSEHHLLVDDGRHRMCNDGAIWTLYQQHSIVLWSPPQHIFAASSPYLRHIRACIRQARRQAACMS